MPTSPYLYANDLIEVLKNKHASGMYTSLVFYLKACEYGSIFEGLLPEGLNIYATIASNADEICWGTYCPGVYPSPPPEYETCLGDLYSVSWMEDNDIHNLLTKTLHQQYELVKKRTIIGNSVYGSYVMQYGDIGLSKNQFPCEIADTFFNRIFVKENVVETKRKSLQEIKMALLSQEAT